MKKLLYFALLLFALSCSAQSGYLPPRDGENTDPEQTEDRGVAEIPGLPSDADTIEVPVHVQFKRDTIIEHYVEFRTGNIPVIISVPHGSTVEGGSINGEEFVLRTKENTGDPSFSTVLDTRTILLADCTDAEFQRKTGKYPYMIIAGIRRKYVDFNRSKQYAIPEGSVANGIAWDTYHDFVKAAKDSVVMKFGTGLLLDFHGHSHDVKQVELGYILSSSDLGLSDEALSANDKYAKKSSIYSLSLKNKNNLSFVELLRGEFSFGDYLHKAGLSCVPRSKKPAPGDEKYFSGGYINKAHGSAANVGGTIDAIQLEFDSTARKSENCEDSAYSLVSAVISYMKKHYYTNAFGR